ncbi:E6 [Human papillomavirus type XS2]|uniref:Protein E6 n=2 Tax=Alphapapillomavirus 2 TaxID=337039 RepID=L7YAW0_9PAPI|nr:E6 [Human papillomavirus type XS2]UNI95525.1 E6 [Human papillomavirus type XS2]BAO74122.1 protein E6 [Human papillomavirus type 78]
MSRDTAGPKNIFILCRDCGIPFDDLRLHCIYCTKQLTTAELASFALRELNLVWRSGAPYGACAQCLLLHGISRRLKYWSYSLYVEGVEEETKESIDTQQIRCYVCHKPLVKEEKDKHRDERRRLHLIAGFWRGSCLHCWSRCTVRIPQ